MGAPHDPEIEAEIDRMYGLPLDEFTPARNALASRLKKAGAREAAAKVAALAKPSVSAWAVNQLRRHRRARLDALLAAGERARDAQREALRGGGGEALRDALREQRDAIAALRRDAAELLAAGGHAPSDTVLDRIETSLQALASDPGALAALGEGRLTRDLEPPGFDALAGLAAGLAPVTRPARPEPVAPSSHPAAKATPLHAPPARIAAAPRSEEEGAADEAPAPTPTKEMSAAKRRELQAVADEEAGREATARRAERARRQTQARKDHAEARRALEQAEKRARAHADELEEAEQRAARMRRAAEAAQAAAVQAEQAASEARAGAQQALERLERARDALAAAEAKVRDDDPQSRAGALPPRPRD